MTLAYATSCTITAILHNIAGLASLKIDIIDDASTLWYTDKVDIKWVSVSTHGGG